MNQGYRAQPNEELVLINYHELISPVFVLSEGPLFSLGMKFLGFISNVFVSTGLKVKDQIKVKIHKRLSNDLPLYHHHGKLNPRKLMISYITTPYTSHFSNNPTNRLSLLWIPRNWNELDKQALSNNQERALQGSAIPNQSQSKNVNFQYHG